jgi:hypothetical protein
LGFRVEEGFGVSGLGSSKKKWEKKLGKDGKNLLSGLTHNFFHLEKEEWKESFLYLEQCMSGKEKLDQEIPIPPEIEQ